MSVPHVPARLPAGALVLNLSLLLAFTLKLRRAGGPTAPVRVPCDACGLRSAPTTQGDLILGAPALCEACEPGGPEGPCPTGAALADPRFDVVDFGDDGRSVVLAVPALRCASCDLCLHEEGEAHDALTSTDFLDWSDTRTREARAHQEATEGALEVWLDLLSADTSLDQSLPCESGYGDDDASLAAAVAS